MPASPTIFYAHAWAHSEKMENMGKKYMDFQVNRYKIILLLFRISVLGDRVLLVYFHVKRAAIYSIMKLLCKEKRGNKL